jgi:hypothetical protein
MSAPELDEAVIADWCARSRASQGLPATITDGSVLAKVVTLALTKSPAAEENGARPAPSRATGR